MPLEINELDLFLGKRVRSFRTKMHWPLKTLSMKIGVSIQQLQRYEAGINKISASLLYILAEEFRTNVESFYEGYQGIQESVENFFPCNNILLIEENNNDELMFRKALIEFPEKLNVFSCHDGKEAINFFRGLEDDVIEIFPKPNLIFLDLHLPHISGFDVLKDIKRRRSLQHIPVIVLTHSTKMEDTNTSYDLHASGVIRKSFSYPKIKHQLHQALTYWIETVQLPIL